MIYRKIELQNVSLEIPNTFISPDWYEILNEHTAEWNEKEGSRKNPSKYKEYLIEAVANKIKPLEPHPFILAFCKMLESIEMREGRDAETWFKRLVAHNGERFLDNSIENMKKDYLEIFDKE